MRAVCLRQKANAHALLAEQRDFEDAIDQALREASDGLTQAVSDLASYCTPSYIEMELGMSRLMLGQAGAAAETFEHGAVGRAIHRLFATGVSASLAYRPRRLLPAT